jgi:predicted glycoside hydrolase/deacetylase ChbG (UPF0249 family)
MKLIIRADDFGYTEEFNRGTMKAVDEGIVTTVDLMLDTPGSEDAMLRIKDHPWISVGWHGGHCWGRPVADPSTVPSLLNEEGRFKYWNDAAKKNDVVYEEALIECRAEVERCIRILGRVPICTEVHPENSLYEKARAQVCDEYGIRYGYMRKKDRRTGITAMPSAAYEALGIFMPTQHESVYKDLYAEKPEDRLAYDPVRYFREDPDHILTEKAAITAWHPGYLDDIIYGMFPANHFHTARVADITALCSNELKQWIIDQKVELVNMNDILLGTQEYQNHLKALQSPLAYGGDK